MIYFEQRSKVVCKAVLIALVIGGIWFVNLPAFAQGALTGNQLLDECASKLMLPQTHCRGFITGVTEGHFLSIGTGKAFFCFPERIKPDQTRKVIVKYLKKHASILDHSAGELVLRALSEAWPCAK